MAITAAISTCTDMHLRLVLTEDANPVDVIQYDVLGALAANAPSTTNGPMYLALNNGGVAFAAQANAQAATYPILSITSTTRAAAPTGATSAPVLVAIPNIAGGAVGNFRLDLGANKVDNVAAADTATFDLDIQFIHSVPR